MDYNKLKGTKTEANLMAAYAGETQARVKYQYYAEKAKQEGYEQMSHIFHETSENEKAHGKIWFTLLHNGAIPSTIANLQDAANGEHQEWSTMYKRMAKEAEEEGFGHIAFLFDQVAKIEEEHQKRYVTLIENLQSQQVFRKDHQVSWQCINCGHLHQAKHAPQLCPVCSHPQSYFQVQHMHYMKG